ncbi:MAG TPA: DUF1549 and DUF1553 domain-containing protein [Gemmataceae bacterium]|nr:DUF1549 and DUF1553 domain-containing protein [Gemmataceae bacterium]
MVAASFSRFSLAVTAALAILLGGVSQIFAGIDVPGAEPIQKVDFERHMMGLFSKMGCNSGSCHGSFQGKNGFRLSLFGFDPDKDFNALTRDSMGRRINPVDPDNSLLLTKPTGEVPHEGGVRFTKGSWQYQIFREWIIKGATRTKGSGEIVQLIVTPPEYAFRKAGETGQLVVKAKFADGSVETVTPFCDFRIQDDAVAEVSTTGQVSSKRAGDTAIVILYRGKVQAVRVLVPQDSIPGFQYTKTPEVNYVDKFVFEKLRRLNMAPSDLSSDLEFLRRVTIDTIGCLPSPQEVRDFLADKSPDKREKKIDQLLQHKLHAAVWATKFSDITGNNTDALETPQQLRPKLSQMWHDWFAKRVQENMPYDEIVHGVLTATSRQGKTPEQWIEEQKKIEEEMGKGFVTHYADRPTLDLFWRRQQQVPIEQWGEKVAAAFLGVRLECAQCHKHPFDRWTQSDYRSFANVFAQTNFGVSPEGQKAINEENKARREKNQGKNNNQLINLREVFVNAARVKPLPNPDTNLPLPAKCVGGPEIQVKAGEDPRAKLFDWMDSPENPFFARSFVNRVWGHYFGSGLVDPVDDFSIANPPSNPALLDALAADFIKHKYDIRFIEKTVLMSRTYQLASKPNATNRLDRRNFSHSQVRPIMAEAVVDVLNSALEVTETYGNDVPAGVHMTEVGASRLQNNNINYVLRIFGRPPRTTACDCERAMDPALPQTLYRMTDQQILAKLAQKDNRVRKLLATKKSDNEVFEELFLATLTRFPTEAEKQTIEKYRSGQANREAAFVDTMWALLNTREFILNH